MFPFVFSKNARADGTQEREWPRVSGQCRANCKRLIRSPHRLSEIESLATGNTRCVFNERAESFAAFDARNRDARIDAADTSLEKKSSNARGDFFRIFSPYDVFVLFSRFANRGL
ncbi:hypothetical protein [Paraburkholderia sp. BR10954]|uniref:hypothetical protein n=1 Tax=Paraburkholderia sp. BR10954 TaxID=3236995 RepID=UPI0034D37031